MRAFVLVALAGCYERIPDTAACTTNCDAAVHADGASDTQGPIGDAPCAGHLGVRICATFGGSISLPPMIDTDTVTCQASIISASGMMCVLAANDIQLSGQTTTVTGSRVLVLYADTISIGANGVLDASSHGSSLGPAHDYPSCPAQTLPQQNTLGGAGGPGGSFGTLGGAGGAGKNGSGSTGTVGASGTLPVSVHGGCRGSDGERSSNAAPGTGGHGGGAVYLLATTSITVDGTINVSGSGGKGSVTAGGAGGGGSGGLIVLDAPSLNVGGVLMASGGGGGGCATGNPADTMYNGLDPDVAKPTMAALGGNGNPSGYGRGGDGSTMGDGGPGGDGEGGVASAQGGGGGGGGGGRNVFYGSFNVNNATIEPNFEIGP